MVNIKTARELTVLKNLHSGKFEFILVSHLTYYMKLFFKIKYTVRALKNMATTTVGQLLL